MADSDLEAKKLHTGRLEEVLVIPMFDIFSVQRAQLAEKTESQNSLLFHFKASMAKVRTWNASTIRNFIGGLTTRFPVLGEEFEKTFQELQEVTCRVLNASSSLNEYNPVVEPTHTYLHELISSCADSFISHPEWFQVSQSSPEYQTVLNNMKVRMAQSAVVPNAIMAFIKTSRRDADASGADTLEQTGDADNSDIDIYESGSEASGASAVSSAKGSKSINVKSGLVTEEGGNPQQDTSTGDAQTVDVPQDTPTEAPTEGTGSVQGVADMQGAENLEDELSDSMTVSGIMSDESCGTFFSDDEYSSGLSLGSSSSDSGSGSGRDSEDSTSTSDSESEPSSCSAYSAGSSSFADTSASDASSDGSFSSREGTEEASDEGFDEGSEEGSDEGPDEGSDEGPDQSSDGESSADSSSAASSASDVSQSSESATSLVWETVSEGSWYTACGSDSGSDM